MTKMIGGILVIEEEEPGKCELCGAFEELRPYGPNGANVCFDCAHKDEKTMKEQFEKRFGGGSGN